MKRRIVTALLIVLTVGISDFDGRSAESLKADDLRQTSLQILTEALHPKLFNVRSAAAKALGESRDGAAVSLLAVALSDQDSMVKSFAVEALAEIGSQAAINGLPRGLKDPDAYIRALAFKALGDQQDARLDPL
jgi:HEAT repeat protein